MKSKMMTGNEIISNRFCVRILSKHIYIMFLCISIFFVGLNSASAQSMDELEKSYKQLNRQLEKENKTLDSLKSIVDYRTEQIDIEKKKKNPDENKIINLMSGTITVSNNIEEQIKKNTIIEQNLERTKKYLHKIYLSKIDSLELLKKSSKKNEDKFDAEILILTEKSLFVAPKIPGLSFIPEKILSIDLKKSSDTKEKFLYKEYLDNALNEINNLLSNVNTQLNEVNQILSLQSKTKKFLEQAEFESNMIIQGQNNQVTEAGATTRSTESIGISNDFASNVKTYQLILNQLDIQQLSKTDLKWKTSMDEIFVNVDIIEYQKLLSEVKKRLQEYKFVLVNKLSSAE